MSIRLVICDLDWTLIGCSSERELLGMLLRERSISPVRLFAFLCGYLLHPVRTLREGRGWNRAYLRGLSAELVAKACNRLAARLQLSVRPEVKNNLTSCLDEGARLYLVSASIEPLVREMSVANGFHGFSASIPEVDDGYCTGRTVGPRPWGGVKVDLARIIMDREGVSPTDTLALGDSFSDRLLLEFCGQAVAVRPGRRMASLAAKKGWKVLE